MKQLFLISIIILAFGQTKTNGQALYENAVGLRAAWGVGITGKHFFNDEWAGEGIINFRNFGTLGFDYNFFRITALAQKHEDLGHVLDGLTWYYGGGAYIGFWSGDWALGLDDDIDQTFIGVAGVVGLDFAFGTVPINISLDWIPSINLVGGGGFGGEFGGVAIRYIIN